MRIPLCKREAATYIKLRRHGYSINTIAKAFGRSTSLIWRILKHNGLTTLQLRKLPAHVRLLGAQRQRLGMLRFFQAWEMWELGEGEKPP